MGTATAAQNAILDLVLRATTWANYAQNNATTPETSIFFQLHTADPGAGGAGNTSESTYTNYARQSVNRSGTAPNWGAPASGVSTLSTAVNFPSSGAAGSTITFFSVGKSGGGASPLLWSGTVTPNIAIGASGIVPQLTTSSTIALT